MTYYRRAIDVHNERVTKYGSRNTNRDPRPKQPDPLKLPKGKKFLPMDVAAKKLAEIRENFLEDNTNKEWFEC